jgi:uncharacterized protein (TIGR03435 family)
MRTSFFLIALLGGCMAVAAQTPKAFEVSSVKPVIVTPGVGFSCGFRWEAEEGGRAAAGRFRTLMPVRCLIALAYDVPVLAVVGGQGWVDEDLFDIDGRSEGPASQGDTRAMLRTLLAQRFGLVVREDSEFKARRWVLEMARPDGRLGPGIRRAGQECSKTLQNAPVSDRQMRPGVPVPCGTAADGTTIAGGGQPFSMVFLRIRLALGEEVIDRTGLTGAFDYFARLPPARGTYGLREDERPSIFTAIQEELGMKLQREEITRGAIIVERVSRPIPN